MSFFRPLTSALSRPLARQIQVFNKTAIKGSQENVVLVDFYADWCQPCRVLTPVMKELTANTDLDLVTINTDSEDGVKLSIEYQVRAMPTVIAFRDGVEIGRFVGAIPKSEVQKFIKSL